MPLFPIRQLLSRLWEDDGAWFSGEPLHGSSLLSIGGIIAPGLDR